MNTYVSIWTAGITKQKQDLIEYTMKILLTDYLLHWKHINFLSRIQNIVRKKQFCLAGIWQMSGFLRRAYISYSRSAQRKTKGGGSWGILKKETCVEEPARGKVHSSAREATDRHRCEVTQRGARAPGEVRQLRTPGLAAPLPSPCSAHGRCA